MGLKLDSSQDRQAAEVFSFHHNAALAQKAAFLFVRVEADRRNADSARWSG